MYIGNIITTSEINNKDFKVCETLEERDPLLPTLIIGWNNTKNILDNKVSIIHKKISENLYWTFSTTERKVDYEKDIKEFENRCYSEFGKDIHYIYIDPFHSKLKTIKKILRKIYSLKEPITYISTTNMLYIYGENMVFGVDLNMMEFIGVTKHKIIDKIKLLPNNILIGNEIFNKCKVLIKKLDNREKLVPYLIKYGDIRLR